MKCEPVTIMYNLPADDFDKHLIGAMEKICGKLESAESNEDRGLRILHFVFGIKKDTDDFDYKKIDLSNKEAHYVYGHSAPGQHGPR